MGMPPIQFHVRLFATDTEAERRRSQKALLWLLESLTRINQLWLSYNPETPALYSSGVVYRPEAGTEHWQDIPTLLQKRSGDCEDLACWRAAELRRQGVFARPYIKWRRVGNSWRYHALVRLPDNRIEDPSLALGMHGRITRRPEFVAP